MSESAKLKGWRDCHESTGLRKSWRKRFVMKLLIIIPTPFDVERNILNQYFTGHAFHDNRLSCITRQSKFNNMFQ